MAGPSSLSSLHVSHAVNMMPLTSLCLPNLITVRVAESLEILLHM